MESTSRRCDAPTSMQYLNSVHWFCQAIVFLDAVPVRYNSILHLNPILWCCTSNLYVDSAPQFCTSNTQFDAVPRSMLSLILWPFLNYKNIKNKLVFWWRSVLPGYHERMNSEGQEDIENIFVRIKMCCEPATCVLELNFGSGWWHRTSSQGHKTA